MKRAVLSELEPKRERGHSKRTGYGPSCQKTGQHLGRHQRAKVYLILLVLWKSGSGFGACTPINPKLCRSIRGWPSGPQEKKTENEAQQIPLVGAHFRIRIDQGHPIRPILDSARFITDQIGRSATTGRLLLQPRELDFKIS